MSHKGHRFSAARLYEVPKGWRPDPSKLSAAAFTPTSPTQELSSGFLPPRGRGEPGDWPFTEVVAGMHIVCLRSQSRSVPKSTLHQEVEQMCKRIEQETGRKPGKRQQKELKEDARQKLLPQAFTRDSDSWGIVCPQRGLLVVNSASQTASSRLTCELVETHTLTPKELSEKGLDSNFYIRPLQMRTSVDSFMLRALQEPEAVKPFGPATFCDLAAADESRRQVSYRNHELTGNEEIKRHLQMGHLPTKLGMYLEASTYFEIDTTLGLHKIIFTGDLFDSNAPADGQADAFDGDFALTGLGLFKVYDELAQVLRFERLDEPSGLSLG